MIKIRKIPSYGWTAGLLLMLNTQVQAFYPAQQEIATRHLHTDNFYSINTIRLLDIPNPEFYHFGEPVGGSLTFVFGTLGTIAEMSQVGEDSQEYDSFDFAGLLKDKLSAHFTSLEYDFASMEIERSGEFELLESYQSVESATADAFIDIVPIEVGYKSHQFGALATPTIAPHIGVVVRVVSASAREVIYADTIWYGARVDGIVVTIDIDAPESHYFENREALMSNKVEAFSNLIDGIDAIASSIAFRFSKAPYVDLQLSDGDSVLKQYISQVGLSGVYRNQSKHPLFRNKNRKIYLRHEGKNITGSLDGKRDHFWGVLKGDEILFEFYPPGSGGGKGKWKIYSATDFVGSWTSKEWSIIKTDEQTDY